MRAPGLVLGVFGDRFKLLLLNRWVGGTFFHWFVELLEGGPAAFKTLQVELKIYSIFREG